MSCDLFSCTIFEVILMRILFTSYGMFIDKNIVYILNTARILHSRFTCNTAICVQAQTANIFARLFTFETGRLPLETEMFHRSCDVSHRKALSYFWRNCHVLMCLRARFNISKPIIICSSHKKYEYKQVWSLLQYRELGNTETYTKAHQNMKNN